MAIALTDAEFEQLRQGSVTASQISGGGSGGGHVPFMMGAIQQTPSFTQMPGISAMFSLLAPQIAKEVASMQNPSFTPQVGPGVSGQLAAYAQNVNTPYYRLMQSQMQNTMNNKFYGTVGQVMANTGLPGQANMTPEQFQQRISQFGQTDIGRIISQQIQKTGVVRDLMGGDPTMIQEQAFVLNRTLSAVAGPGGIVDPAELMKSGSEIAGDGFKRAQFLQQEILSRMYPNNSLIPSAEFTRGFGTGDVADMMRQLSTRSRDFRVTNVERGADALETGAELRTNQLESRLRTVGLLSDLLGGETYTNTMRKLEQLTQGDWPNIQPERLDRVFRNIGATVSILQSSGAQVTRAQMVEGMSSMQQGMGRIMATQSTGIADVFGMPVNSVKSPEFSFLMENTAMATAQAMGVASNPAAVERIRGRQMAMMGSGLRSNVGRDLTLAEFLHSRGRISSTELREVHEAAAGGNLTSARGVATEVFKKAFGNTRDAAEYARSMVSTEAGAERMERVIGGERLSSVGATLINAQPAGAMERINTRLYSRIRNLNRSLEHGAGVRVRFDDSGQFYLGAIKSVLGEEAALGFEDVYAERGMSGVRAMLGGDLYNAKRKQIEDKASQLEEAETTRQMHTISDIFLEPRARERALTARLGRDDMEKASGIMRDATKLAEDGDISGARKAVSRADAYMLGQQANIKGPSAALVQASIADQQKRQENTFRNIEDVKGATELQMAKASGEKPGLVTDAMQAEVEMSAIMVELGFGMPGLFGGMEERELGLPVLDEWGPLISKGVKEGKQMEAAELRARQTKSQKSLRAMEQPTRKPGIFAPFTAAYNTLFGADAGAGGEGGVSGVPSEFIMSGEFVMKDMRTEAVIGVGTGKFSAKSGGK